MNIILIRHGDAENSSPSIKDFERQLTKEGEVRTRKNLLYLKNFISSFDYIVSSPLIRAQQTAKIAAEVFKYKTEIITEKRLTGNTVTEDIIDIANYLDAKNIAFIGHQPSLANAVSDLISSGANVEFKKSAAAKISFSKKVFIGKGVLEFLLPPVPEK
jgi:phosphohistidine phosphatase